MTNLLFWSVKNLYEAARARQQNELDFIICFSGNRGQGKSTCGWKFSRKFGKEFKPLRDICYSRKEIMRLLQAKQYGVIMDDEAIRSAYKRNFQEQDQKIYVQMLNMYRDNFNVLVMCVPQFYSLDRDLRDLIKVHVHVIKRGLAVVHFPNNTLYSDDIWDVRYNQKVEEKWTNIKKKNPDYVFPYHRLTTFAGYLVFGKMRKKEEQVYKWIKRTKRQKVYDDEMKLETDDESKYKVLLERIKLGQMNRAMFTDFCQLNNITPKSLMDRLNIVLKNSNVSTTVSQYHRTYKPVEKFEISKYSKVKIRDDGVAIPQI
jgi:hypothetical protein